MSGGGGGGGSRLTISGFMNLQIKFDAYRDRDKEEEEGGEEVEEEEEEGACRVGAPRPKTKDEMLPIWILEKN